MRLWRSHILGAGSIVLDAWFNDWMNDILLMALRIRRYDCCLLLYYCLFFFQIFKIDRLRINSIILLLPCASRWASTDMIVMSSDSVYFKGWSVNDNFFVFLLARYITTFPVFIGNERITGCDCFVVCIACVFPTKILLLVHFKFE